MRCLCRAAVRARTLVLGGEPRRLLHLGPQVHGSLKKAARCSAALSRPACLRFPPQEAYRVPFQRPLDPCPATDKVPRGPEPQPRPGASRKTVKCGEPPKLQSALPDCAAPGFRVWTNKQEPQGATELVKTGKFGNSLVRQPRGSEHS